MATQLALMTREEFEDRKEQVNRGIKTFVEVGLALLDIRGRKGYRLDGYGSFEEFCRDEWGMSQPRAYQLMDAASVAGVLSGGKSSTIVELPKTESHARELAPLAKSDPDAAREVWQQVNEQHGTHVTASKVREAVRARMPRPEPARVYECPECGDQYDSQSEARACCSDEPAELPLPTNPEFVPERSPSPQRGPNLREQARRSPGVRWRSTLEDINTTLNAIRDNGGIDELAARWSPQERAAYVREIDAVLTRLNDVRRILISNREVHV